jgi:hypothetical protein
MSSQQRSPRRTLSEIIEESGHKPVNLTPATDVDAEVAERAQLDVALAKQRHLQGFPVIGAKPQDAVAHQRRKKKRSDKLREQNSDH